MTGFSDRAKTDDSPSPAMRLIVLVFLFLLLCPTFSLAATYYVARNGNDSNDGLTEITPWQGLDPVNSRIFQPGDCVLFRRGDTWREELRVTSSGTPEAWVTTYGAFGSGSRPSFLGSETATGWIQAAPNIWRSATPLENPYQGGYSVAEVYFKERDGSFSTGRYREFDPSFSGLVRQRDWS
ncbi:MAG: hypothetical protein EOM25_10735 [Deltaproteobacteria bacterium]|nr:hypothetical protein [Deltaproteobacteria bacterium]